MTINWSAWALDVFTWGWIVWMLAFVGWETFAVVSDVRNTLTWHLRPLFHAAPLTWYLGVALWLWMGPHFFFPEFERMLSAWVKS